MIRIKISLQFKMFLMIIILFLILLNVTVVQINQLVSQQVLLSETRKFESLRTLFYNMLRMKIRSVETEAILLAGQIDVKSALESWSAAQMSVPFKVSSLPHAAQRDLILVADSSGAIVDGMIRLENEQNIVITENRELESIFNLDLVVRDVFFGYRSARYLRLERCPNVYYFAIVSVPVFSDSLPMMGSVSLGIPVNEELFREIRTGNHFEIAFVFGEQIVTSSFDLNQNTAFTRVWSALPSEQRASLIDKPQILTFQDERFLASAAPLPLDEDRQGLYVILASLEDTFRFMEILKQSVFWVSIIVLLGILLIAFFITRGVTSPVRVLLNAVSQIAKGHYSVDASVNTGDELEALGNEINQMATMLLTRDIEIKTHVRQIEKLNLELEKKVTERTQDLENKNLRLRLISEELGRAYGRMDDELKIVGEMQKNLLPPSQVDCQGLLIRSIYSPSGRAGGDYFDLIMTGKNQIFSLVADVSGHGIPAAFIMGMTRAMAHTLIEKGSSPREVLLSLSNILLKTIRRGEFITMFLARLDLTNQVLTYSSAGHPAPLWLDMKNMEIKELLVNHGVPLGIVEDTQYEEIAIPFPFGDRLLLYTDGVVEAFNEDKKAYGVERLKTVFLQKAHENIDRVVQAIMDDLEFFTQSPLEIDSLVDDVTLVAIENSRSGEIQDA
jgi:serine phosphatase RsbU (regulator of sigma subunit)